MKKILSTVLGASLIFTLTGCGSDNTSTSGTSSAGSDDEEVTLTMTMWETYEQEGMEKIAEAFEAEHENIDVNIEVTPWSQYWVKLEAASTGGTAPDIVTMLSSEFYNYASNDQLLDLSDLVDNGDVNLSNYREEITELYTVEDTLYAVPKDIDSMGLWYNKALFDEAGVPYPDETWTWETFLEAAKTLTNEEEGIYGFAAPNTGQDGYNSFIFQNGGQVMSDDRESSMANDPNTVEALQWFVDLSTKEKVSPTDDQLSENDAVTRFQSGKLAMIVQGSWMCNQFRENEYVRENCDVAVLPKGKQNATQMNGKGYAISSHTEHPEEAKEFMTFLASEEAMQIQAEYGTAIPAYNGLEQAWVDAIDTFNAQAFVDELDYGYMKPYSKATKQAETAFSEGLREAFNGTKQVSELTPAIEDEVNVILEQAK